MARAMRVSELITDFRSIQNQILSIRLSPSNEEYNEEGFQILRQCISQARQLLQQPFAADPDAWKAGNEEQNKSQLKRIIMDAAVRRFKARKIYLRAVVAMKWANSRQSVLDGQRPHARHADILQQLRQVLRNDYQTITDTYVETELVTADQNEGKWLDEDPSLVDIQRVLGVNA